MCRRFRIILTLLASLLIAFASAQLPVRVLLGEAVHANVHMSGPHSGYASSGVEFTASLPLDWPLTASGDTLLVDGKPVGTSLTLAPHAGVVRWEDLEYRGALTFVARGSRLLVINHLELEDYLRGVVPSEMQASWPDDALRAQAIAARSYTLTSLRPDLDYDICATDSCQVYRGTEVEHPGSDAAVAATHGLVLTHLGEFARAYYHSDSGGVTASGAEVWGTDLAYLPTLTDVSVTSPHRGWTATLGQALVSAAVRNAGREVGTVSSMNVLAYSDSGRVASLQVNGSSGSTVFDGHLATSFLRGLGLKSTRLTFTGALSVRGDGWGHGVGMSQYGARSLADSGYSYDQILAFYYPGTQLSRLSFLSSPAP